MATFTDDVRPILTDAQIGELLIEPVIAAAISAQDGLTTAVERLDAGSWRGPRMTQEPTAAWVAQGDEIPMSDAAFDEIEVVPAKVSGWTLVSSEALEDSNAVAAALIGEGLVNSIVKQIDAAFLGDLPLPAPPGLNSAGFQGIVAGALDDLDMFAFAVSLTDQLGALLTAWVCGPAMAHRLATLKAEENGRVPLLALDPALPTRRVIEGRPVLVAPDVPPNEVWGLCASRVRTLVRTDAQVEASGSPFFTRDEVAIRAKMRVGFAFLQPETNIHMTFSA